MLQANMVPGIHRIEQAYTNFYIVEDAGRLTIVDTGFPASWSLLLSSLDDLGFERKDIAAVAITHAHFDHLGFAARAHAELNVPVWIHRNETFIARHPYKYDHEKSRLLYLVRYPKSIPIEASMIQAGALRVPGITEVQIYDGLDVLDVPGRPRIVYVPGHTYGHVAFYFEDKDALLTGDSLVTLDPYTAETGPRIVSQAATADSKQALTSLDVLEATGAGVLLPGHGDPWRDGIEAAVRIAKEKGIA